MPVGPIRGCQPGTYIPPPPPPPKIPSPFSDKGAKQAVTLRKYFKRLSDAVYLIRQFIDDWERGQSIASTQQGFFQRGLGLLQIAENQYGKLKNFCSKHHLNYLPQFQSLSNMGIKNTEDFITAVKNQKPFDMLNPRALYTSIIRISFDMYERVSAEGKFLLEQWDVETTQLLIKNKVSVEGIHILLKNKVHKSSFRCMGDEQFQKVGLTGRDITKIRSIKR